MRENSPALSAKLLARISGDKCHVSRHGGEEFVLLFRGLASTQAKERLAAARGDLSGRRLLNRRTEEPFGQITFSAGVTDVFAPAAPCDALKAADGALYRAKPAGPLRPREGRRPPRPARGPSAGVS